MELIKLEKKDIAKGFGVLSKVGTVSYTKERGVFVVSDNGVVALREKKIPFQIIEENKKRTTKRTKK